MRKTRSPRHRRAEARLLFVACRMRSVRTPTARMWILFLSTAAAVWFAVAGPAQVKCVELAALESNCFLGCVLTTLKSAFLSRPYIRQRFPKILAAGSEKASHSDPCTVGAASPALSRAKIRLLARHRNLFCRRCGDSPRGTTGWKRPGVKPRNAEAPAVLAVGHSPSASPHFRNLCFRFQ